MKKIYHNKLSLASFCVLLLLSALIFFSDNQLARAQSTNPVDTAIIVSLENPIRQGDSIFMVDIYLARSSDIWHLWENATFQMIFTTLDGSEIDYSKFDVSVDATSSEIVTLQASKPVYDFYPKVLFDAARPQQNRVMLVVIGPEEAIYAKLFTDEVKLKLCTIILHAQPGATLPTSMDWKRLPNDEIYYLGTAYKYVESVNQLPQYVFESKNEDNVEIGWITKHVSYPVPDPAMQLAHFEAVYTGNMNAVCRYGTQSEINNAGFIIKRAEVRARLDTADNFAAYEALPDSIFNHTVGDYRRPQDNDRMKGQIYSHVPKEYEPIHDVLSHREMNYVYRLYYDKMDASGVNIVTTVATRGFVTPNGLITKASAYPNPSSGRSVVSYEVSDDVYLTCELYDQNGGKIKTLYDTKNGILDKTYVPIGTYSVVFEVPDLAAQGLYDVHFVAYPVNDKSVEHSTANVKVQVIRDIKDSEE